MEPQYFPFVYFVQGRMKEYSKKNLKKKKSLLQAQ